jgi:hypothetical protein
MRCTMAFLTVILLLVSMLGGVRCARCAGCCGVGERRRGPLTGALQQCVGPGHRWRTRGRQRGHAALPQQPRPLDHGSFPLIVNVTFGDPQTRATNCWRRSRLVCLTNPALRTSLHACTCTVFPANARAARTRPLVDRTPRGLTSCCSCMHALRVGKRCMWVSDNLLQH